jgi:hypothetical protein
LIQQQLVPVSGRMLFLKFQIFVVRIATSGSKLSSGGGRSVAAEGYSLSRNTLTDFASSIENSLLKSMTFEELREKSAYKFNLNFNTSNQQNQNE